MAQLKTYRDSYGAWPSGRSGNTETRRLASWLALQRGTDIPSHRRALLDEQTPGWDESYAAAYERTAQDIAAYRKTHGEWPSASSREQSERRIARWLSDQRSGRNVTAEREALLDMIIPGWREGLSSQPLRSNWERRVDDVVRFRQAYGRFPRSSGTAQKNEQRLYRSLLTWRGSIALPENRQALLDELLPGWRGNGAVAFG